MTRPDEPDEPDEPDDDGRAAGAGPCRGDDDPGADFGHGWYLTMREHAHDQARDAPGDAARGERWPEPRALWQDDWWRHRDGTVVDVRALDPDGAALLLERLLRLATPLHAAAADDERRRTGRVERHAWSGLGVLPVAETDPIVWLRSTVLVRSLRARADGGPGYS